MLTNKVLMLIVLDSLIKRDAYGRISDAEFFDYMSVYKLLQPYMDEEEDYDARINKILLRMHLSNLIDLGERVSIKGLPISIKIRQEGINLCQCIESYI